MPENKLRGIVFPKSKKTSGMTIIPMEVPDMVYIPMKQAPGEVYLPIASPGDRVKLGQLIAEAGSPRCAPIHSSVSGEIVSIDTLAANRDADELYIKIRTDGRQDLHESVVPPRIRSSYEFFEVVRSSGLLNFGRDRTPLSTVLENAADAKVDTLIVNGTESEPFLSAGGMNMLSFPGFMKDGALAIMEHLGLNRGIFAVGSDKKPAMEALKKELAGENRLELYSVRDYYPNGFDTVLITEVTGKLLPPGKKPADLGILILDCGSVIKLGQLLDTGLPLVSRSITVDGDAIARPMNVEVPIGTHVTDLIAFCGGEKAPIRKIIIGGPITGRTIENSNYSVGKDDSALLCFSELYAKDTAESSCIRCSRCAAVCPMDLMPMRIMDAVRRSDGRAFSKLSAFSCIGCSACSYACPARIRLSERIMKAVAYFKNAGKAEGSAYPSLSSNSARVASVGTADANGAPSARRKGKGGRNAG